MRKMMNQALHGFWPVLQGHVCRSGAAPAPPAGEAATGSAPTGLELYPQ
jgi:hypothetical protein